MKISSRPIPAPPREIVMQFSQTEGWPLLAALSDWIMNHPGAADVERWKQWYRDLKKEVNRL